MRYHFINLSNETVSDYRSFIIKNESLEECILKWSVIFLVEQRKKIMMQKKLIETR